MQWGELHKSARGRYAGITKFWLNLSRVERRGADRNPWLAKMIYLKGAWISFLHRLWVDAYSLFSKDFFRHDITELLWKVALNIKKPNPTPLNILETIPATLKKDKTSSQWGVNKPFKMLYNYLICHSTIYLLLNLHMCSIMHFNCVYWKHA